MKYKWVGDTTLRIPGLLPFSPGSTFDMDEYIESNPGVQRLIEENLIIPDTGDIPEVFDFEEGNIIEDPNDTDVDVLNIQGCLDLNIPEALNVINQIDSKKDLEGLLNIETKGKNRKTVLEAIVKRLGVL